MAGTNTHQMLEEIKGYASESEKSLPCNAKLELLDKEIRLLREYCLKMGLNDKEIETCAEPLLTVRRKGFRKLCLLSIFVAFIAFIFWFEPTYRFVCIFGKLASMKLLPYWDWTVEYEKDCFVENPYYVEDMLTEEDCDVCKNISGARLNNVSHNTMANKYLYNAIPVVITDSTDQWAIPIDRINVDTLKKIYLDKKHANHETHCTFDAFSPDIESPQQLFSLVEEENLQQWQGYWENCEPSTAKRIRMLYRRPYFLPPMAESAPENWIFAANTVSQESSLKWEHVQFGASATWMTQIKGRSRVVLTPLVPCDRICKKMSATLNPGESIIFVNRYWGFKRKPVAGEISISVAATVNWDQL